MENMDHIRRGINPHMCITLRVHTHTYTHKMHWLYNINLAFCTNMSHVTLGLRISNKTSV